MMDEATKKQFAREMLQWLDGEPKERHDWIQALVAAALDETGGDLVRALELAKAEYALAPEPPSEEELT